MNQPIVIDLLQVAHQEGTNWMTLAANAAEAKRLKAISNQVYLRNRHKLWQRHAKTQRADAYNPDEPRDPHGRFGEGSYPDISKDMSHGLDKNETAQQPVKSLDELYERAKQAEPAFKADVEASARVVGSYVEFTPPQFAEPGTTLKARSSSERKLKTELNDDPTMLRDVLRATIVGRTAAEARSAASQFIGDHAQQILRVKDRFSHPTNGYRDILVNYRTPSGLVAEVQFGGKEMLHAKNGDGHRLYDEIRNVAPGGRIASGTVAQQLSFMNNKISELYDNAYKADGNGRGWQHA